MTRHCSEFLIATYISTEENMNYEGFIRFRSFNTLRSLYIVYWTLFIAGSTARKEINLCTTPCELVCFMVPREPAGIFANLF